MDLLTEDAIRSELTTVPDWAHVGDSIKRTVTREDFEAAMLYVGAIAYVAQEADHHPDILIQWNKVTLTVSTHSAGGLTARDFSLARTIDTLT
jgi:4a-hydroxytetrahydrobiopterin dehydratase